MHADIQCFDTVDWKGLQHVEIMCHLSLEMLSIEEVDRVRSS